MRTDRGILRQESSEETGANYKIPSTSALNQLFAEQNKLWVDAISPHRPIFTARFADFLHNTFIPNAG